MSLPTVKCVEAGNGPRVSEEARLRLQWALESGGVEFIDENGGGPLPRRYFDHPLAKKSGAPEGPLILF